ncbi:ATP-binding protein [Burkholderia sp. Leaf177]|uniref:ATP-binding protein n=1 Tax=Burkholderia sp. Leaf177 TaxID=1736287 RepID=UPI0009E6C2B3|nr:ATP-binding protein [Burkholderia sp. Leaf177]
MGYQTAPILPNEASRLGALEKLGVLDTLPEQAYDDIVALAMRICEVPIALVSIIDRERQWFKACIGLDVRETHRDAAFCAHAILQPNDLFIVEDASKDERFSENPLVVGGPEIRFYAGAPIVTENGYALGTVCVIDTVPRGLSEEQQRALKALARQTAALLQLRILDIERAAQTESLRHKIIDALADDEREHAPFRQRQRVASIGQLTSGLAHDFNNLLQSVSVSLQLIERKADNLAIKRYATTGLQSVERGAKLIARLLAFSRDETPAREAISVSEQIAGMRDLLTSVLSANVRLRFDLETSGVRVTCDATQVEAAILNMVINARDAMENSGEIRILTRMRDVVCEPGVTDGQYLELRVTDTGPGMPYSVASRVFEPFFSTKGNKGTGLGLSQVYGLAMKCSGTAMVETNVGKGTSIVLLLKPVATYADVTPNVQLADEDITSAALKANILIVDDNVETHRTLVELLVDAGYAVRSAQTASAAIYAIEDMLPDAVVANFSMRGMSGPVLQVVLREYDPLLPVIFMTGESNMDVIKGTLKHDAILLQKPFQIETLAAAIDEALGLKVSAAR